MRVVTVSEGEHVTLTLRDGSLVTVRAVEVRRGKVRLQVDARRDVRVDRLEIHEARQAARR